MPAIHGMSAISKLNTQSFLNLKMFRQQYFSFSQLHMSTILIYQHIYTYIFYATYASKVRAACIVATYNNDSKATIRLSERGRSCLAFVTSGMFGRGIVPKEKVYRIFSPVSIQEQDLYLETWLWSPLICIEKAPCGSGYTELCERIQF